MDTEQELEQNKKENKKRSDENLAKLAITKEADKCLVDLINRIHDGFDAGKATKQDVASLVIMSFHKDAGENEIHELRKHFFDPIILLEATLKIAKETGVLPDQIKNLIYDQFEALNKVQPSAKRTKKQLKSYNIKDMVNEDLGAA